MLPLIVSDQHYLSPSFYIPQVAFCLSHPRLTDEHQYGAEGAASLQRAHVLLAWGVQQRHSCEKLSICTDLKICMKTCLGEDVSGQQLWATLTTFNHLRQPW